MIARLPIAIQGLVLTCLLPSDVSVATQSQTSAMTASIGGRVASADTVPVPIKRASVTLNSDDANVHVSVVADDAGRFEFTGLPAGRFTVSAEKAPFVTQSFGASSPGKFGAPVVVAAGEAKRDLVLRLLRGAAITGTVFDPQGEPAPFQYMSLLRRTLTEAGRSLVAVNAHGPAFGTVPSYGVTTDDRGIYRFYGLAPGDYVVVVGARSTPGYRPVHQTTADDISRATSTMRAPVTGPSANTAMVFSVRPLSLPADAVGEVPVFYPGTVTAAEASAVHVDAGEEKAGIDVRVVLGKSGSLDASFVTPSGGGLNGFAHIVGDQLPGTTPISAQVSRLEDGAIHRPGLSPGHYRIEARGTTTDATGQAVVLWGTTDATVNGGDGPVVSVQHERAPIVTGRLVFDERVDGVAMPSISVVLEPADPIPGSFATAIRVTADRDRFTFPGVPTGRYRLRAEDRAGGPGVAGWRVETATIDGQDVLSTPVELRANESRSDVVITMTRRKAALAGSFSDASGRPTSAFTVVVFAADEKNWFWNSARIRAVHLATDGTYVVDDLPAGDYLVAAVADVEASDWFDPEFLSRIRPAAIAVRLVTGTKVTQNIRVAR